MLEKETKEILLGNSRIPPHNFGALTPMWGKRKSRTYSNLNPKVVNGAADDPPLVQPVAEVQEPNQLVPLISRIEDAPPVVPVKKLELENLNRRLRLRLRVLEKKGPEDGDGCGEREQRLAKKEKVRFQVALTKKEVDEDFQKIFDSGIRPNRQLKKVQKALNYKLFPAMSIREISADNYKVRQPPSPSSSPLAVEGENCVPHCDS